MRKARKHKVLLSFALASLMTVSGVVNVSAAVPVNEQIIKTILLSNKLGLLMKHYLIGKMGE